MNLELGLTMMVVALVGLADCWMIFGLNRKNNRLMDYMHSADADMEKFDHRVAKITRLRSALRSQLIVHYVTVSYIVFHTKGFGSLIPYLVAAMAAWQIFDFFTGSRNADPLCYHPKAYTHYTFLAGTSLWLALVGFNTLNGV